MQQPPMQQDSMQQAPMEPAPMQQPPMQQDPMQQAPMEPVPMQHVEQSTGTTFVHAKSVVVCPRYSDVIAGDGNYNSMQEKESDSESDDSSGHLSPNRSLDRVSGQWDSNSPACLM